MRVLELFAGYGSQALALENLGVDFSSDISEIDKYAIQAYEQLHGNTHNWGDITKIDESKLPYYDLITYSSPCQDFSIAGLQKGGDAGTGTRSSLLWECERIIRAVKPKYLLMENVKNLVGEKHKHNFIRWLRVLEMMGYQNYWKVLNAKDYGVPQNRERVFVVSILGGGQYLFPNPVKLEKRLKDVLESNVDEKYYLSDKFIQGLTNGTEKQLAKNGRFVFRPTDGNCIGMATTSKAGTRAVDNYIKEPVCVAQRGRENGQQFEINKTGCSNTLTSVQKDNYLVEPQVKQVGNIVETDSFGGNPQRGRIYSDEGVSPALSTMQGGGLEPEIIQSSHGFNKGNVYKNAPTITSSGYENNNFLSYNYRIRKLTPRECWRLMGVKDEQFDKLHDLSNTQLYKLAGNSIVVDVLMGIFKNLLLSDKGTSGQLTLF